MTFRNNQKYLLSVSYNIVTHIIIYLSLLVHGYSLMQGVIHCYNIRHLISWGSMPVGDSFAKHLSSNLFSYKNPFLQISQLTIRRKSSSCILNPWLYFENAWKCVKILEISIMANFSFEKVTLDLHDTIPLLKMKEILCKIGKYKSDTHISFQLYTKNGSPW